MNADVWETAPAISVEFERPAPVAAQRHALRKRQPRRRLLLFALAIAGLAWFCEAPPYAPAPDQASSGVAPRLAAFVEDARLPPLFDIAGLSAPIRYRAQANPTDGSRKDHLTSGGASAADSFFTATLRRGPSALAPEQFFVDMAGIAAEIGAAVERSGVPILESTWRGPVQIAELTLSAAGGARNCLGFRLALGVGASLSGLSCAAQANAADRAGLACLLDRLTLTKAGRDLSLGEVASKPGARPACRKPAA